MPYPFTLSNGAPSYADVAHTQSYFVSFQIASDPSIGPAVVEQFLESVTAEIDALLLRKGYLVPPPSGARILPILRDMCAIGAAALVQHARFENGDESGLQHANGLMNVYDASLGLIERDDVNPGLLGMISAGWSEQPDQRTYFNSGNIQPLPSDTPDTILRDVAIAGTRGPFFTMNMQW